MAKIDYRLAQAEDLDVLEQFMASYYTYDGVAFNAEAARTALADLIAHPDWGQIWLICAEIDPIGYAVITLGYSLEYLGRDAFVDEIYLSSAYRGQGIGTKTFEFLEAQCRRLGVKALHLEVEAHNTKAQAFYRKIGFESGDRHLLNKWL